MECEEEEAVKEDFLVSDVGNWISSLYTENTKRGAGR